MRRSECLQALAPMLTDQLVVTNVARTGFETHMAMPREGNLYTMGMGLVTPVVLGLALSLPHRGVIALDGDGSILLISARSPRSAIMRRNLISIIFDDESYASTGGLPTATAGKTELVAIAKGAGIERRRGRQDRGFHRGHYQGAGRPRPLGHRRQGEGGEAAGGAEADGWPREQVSLRALYRGDRRTVILKPSVVGRKDS